MWIIQAWANDMGKAGYGTTCKKQNQYTPKFYGTLDYAAVLI